MLDLHFWPTPNGKKVSILLEELGLDYNLVPCNIGRGDQFKPEFLKINPNHRMPVLVDHNPKGGGAPISIFESAAITTRSTAASSAGSSRSPTQPQSIRPSAPSCARARPCSTT